jgi:F0F1-type ATP synthase assembly protein I
MADGPQDGNKSTNGEGGGTLHPSEQKRSQGTPVLGDLVKAESMIQLALMLPAGCLIGALGGTALDKHFHTGWIAVVGILLGAAAGFVAIYRTASRAMKRDG